MIKIEELRIGNLIWNPVQQCPCKVDMAVMGKIQADAYLKSKGNEVVEFEPIPLTEQWLIDFGFTDNCYPDSLSLNVLYRGVLNAYGVSTNPRIEIGTKSGIIFGHSEIKYVHQLQNLFYSLTGEELTKK